MGLTDKPVGVESIVLERLRYAYNYRLGPGVMQSTKLTQLPDIIHNEMMLKLEAEVLAEKIEEQEIKRTETVVTHIEVPDGRLQRWKERYWDRRWCRWLCLGRRVRWVYKERTTKVVLIVTVKDYAAFPYSAYMPAPPEFGPVVFKRFTESFTAQNAQEDKGL